MNRMFVGLQGDDVTILKLSARVTRRDALNLAAWLVAVADDDDEFDALLAAVRAT